MKIVFCAKPLVDKSCKLPVIYDDNFSGWGRASVISWMNLCNNAKGICFCHLLEVN